MSLLTLSLITPYAYYPTSRAARVLHLPDGLSFHRRVAPVQPVGWVSGVPPARRYPPGCRVSATASVQIPRFRWGL